MLLRSLMEFANRYITTDYLISWLGLGVEKSSLGSFCLIYKHLEWTPGILSHD